MDQLKRTPMSSKLESLASSLPATLGVDSMFILFNHRCFQKADLFFSWVFGFPEKTRIPGLEWKWKVAVTRPNPEVLAVCVLSVGPFGLEVPVHLQGVMTPNGDGRKAKSKA